MEIADTDASGNIIRRYVPGAGVDQRFAMITVDAASGTETDRHFYHTNRLGSVIALTDTVGNVTDQYVYTPYGVESPLTGSGNPFRYTGRRYDTATDLYYYRARFYSAELGRFLQTDPVGYADQMNLYNYVHNDPLNNTDPTGEFANFVAKFVVDVGLEVAIQVATGQDINIGSAAKGAAMGLLDPTKTARKVAKLGGALNDVRKARSAQKLGGKCCFVAGTLVETEDGLRPIEEIKVGDLVLSRNPETGETAYKEVTAFIPRHERIIWTVSLSGANKTSENFETTDEHPWWVIGQAGDGNWKRTDELTAGMIVTTADNQTMTILSALETERLDGTYNITVADFETYFVGENKILVHNCGNQKDLLQDQSPELRDALQGKSRAPESSVPFDTKTRLNEDGSIKQVTTYDGTGRRKTQFDLKDGRRSEHKHDFEDFSPGSPNGVRSGHRELDDIRE